MNCTLKGAIISDLLLLFCYILNGNSYILKEDVSAISLINESRWCSGRSQKQYLRVDFGRETTITGLASRKDDSVREFTLSYKNDDEDTWYFYEEEGRVKIFRAIANASGGRFIRHWLQHAITTRHMKFHVGNMKLSSCLHVEIYGWENTEKRASFSLGNSGSRMFSQELNSLMDLEERKDDQGVEQDIKEKVHRLPMKPTPLRQDKPKERHMSLTITICFIATGLIAIFALIIVCKWEKHERKIRPDNLKADLRERLKSSFFGGKRN